MTPPKDAHTVVKIIKTFVSDDERVEECDVVSIRTRDRGRLELPLLTVPLIFEPLIGQPICYSIEAHSHLSELDLVDLPRYEGELAISVLVGSDNYWKLVTCEVINQDNCPTAVKTLLSWVLSGPIEGLTENLSLTNYTSIHALELESHLILYEDSSQDLETRLKRFWDLETLGIRDSEENIYNKFVNNMSFKNGRYKVKLPWKEPHTPLPDNYQLSLKRLTGLLRQLRRGPQILNKYDAIIAHQLDKGIMEIVKE